MKKTFIFILIFVFPLFAITFFYDVSHADYLIKLKNDREIFISKYKDTGEHISFFYQGGKVTISKEDVEEIKDVEANADEGGTYVPEYSEESLEAPFNAVAADVAGDKKKNELSELMSELSSIYTQKQALIKEREELFKNHEKLSREVEKEGARVPRSRGKKFKRRAEALKEDIESFNERVADIEKKKQTVKNRIESLEKEGM